MNELIQSYGSLIISIGTFGYLVFAKIQKIPDILKALGKIEDRQINHEGRISFIEGKQNGKVVCK